MNPALGLGNVLAPFIDFAQPLLAPCMLNYSAAGIQSFSQLKYHGDVNSCLRCKGSSLGVAFMRRPGATLTEDELKAYNKEHLGGYKKPKKI